MTRLAAVLGWRLAQALVVAMAVGTMSFFLMRSLPGDMAYRIAASRYGLDMVTGAAAAAVRAELHLDRPAVEALALWWSNLLRLDLGVSAVTGRPVWSEIAEQLGHTARLAAAALTLSVILGIPTGFLAGLRPRSWLDRCSLALAVVFRATPPFLVGLFLIIGLSLRSGLAPAAGPDDAAGLALPALTLALGLAASSSRVARDAMARTAAAPFLEFARTKGLTDRAAVVRHALRNAATPVVAYLGVQLAFLLEGVVVVETLFAWPGIGHALVHALFGRDIPMVQGTVLVLGLGLVLLSTAVDIVCLVLDPRPRA